jgi:hypothetical protein
MLTTHIQSVFPRDLFVVFAELIQPELSFASSLALSFTCAEHTADWQPTSSRREFPRVNSSDYLDIQKDLMARTA